MKTPAQIIAAQIGNGTFFMLGARGSLMQINDGRCLSFRVKGAKDRINTIEIELNQRDLYTVRFKRMTMPTVRSEGKDETICSLDNVHVEDLHELIERNTGLATRMPRVMGIG